MFLSVILVGYAVAAVVFTQIISADDKPYKLDVVLSDPSNPFVTEQEVLENAFSVLPENFTMMPLDSIDLQEVEDRLNAIDNIEEANVYCVYCADRQFLRAEVSAMRPVARVFDSTGSYYINRQGKRLTANYRYRVNVPVVVGEFNDRLRPTYVIPLVNYMNNDRRFNSLVSSLEVEPDGDIIICSMIVNARINFGDTTNIKDKIQRIMLAYTKVLPVRGWDFYDTISVKFDNQIVAHRRSGPPVYSSYLDDGEDTDENVDFNYMDTIPEHAGHN